MAFWRGYIDSYPRPALIPYTKVSRSFGACGNKQVIIGFGEMMHRQVTAQIQIIIVEVVASAIILLLS